MDYIKEKLYQQLAIDYCSQISDIKDDKNHFMKVLVTGFDPFGGENVNPAYEAVKLLPDIIEGAQIIKLEIPTVFKNSKRGSGKRSARCCYKCGSGRRTSLCDRGEGGNQLG